MKTLPNETYSFKTQTRTLVEFCMNEKERSAIKIKLQQLRTLREKRLLNELRARKVITHWLRLCFQKKLKTTSTEIALHELLTSVSH